MKVESFLQHCNSREKFTPEEEADARKFFVERGVRYIRDWYSQPFKPELITELFEGWYLAFEGCYRHRSISLPLFEDEIVAFRMGGVSYNRTSREAPLILDEFISNCIRNGIELKWKEINKEVE